MRHSSIELLEARRLLSSITADFDSAGGALLKPGLGSLFGVTALAGGTDQGLLNGSTLTNSAAADPAGVTNVNNPMSLANIASILRGTKAKTIVRYADMLSGFPYNWVSLADWDNKVTGETTAIKNNFKDVVRAIAVFNEPDNTFVGNFTTDPALQGSTYDAKVNYLWTHTVQEIRAIDPTIPLMGPNYVSYYPQYKSADQTRMSNFLQNAIATNTVPDFMAWHLLYYTNPADFGTALNSYYRPLETSLGLPKLPVICEEYGYNNNNFEGVPGATIPYWAEFERDKVAYASVGVYDNGGTLGNEVQYFGEANQQPNAGWYAANWYMNMNGVYVPTSAASTRGTGAYDGIASYDAASQTATVLLGGPDNQATVSLLDIAAKLGSNVRVQLREANWTVDSTALEPHSTLLTSGDPIISPFTVFDKVYAADGSGNVNVNFHIENNNAYELVITPAAIDPQPRYEAENARPTNVTTATSSVASNARYVTGIVNSDSVLSFTVIVPNGGLYSLNLGYAAASASTLGLSINGSSQSDFSFTSTGGTLATTEGIGTRKVGLIAGVNTITFSKSSGSVDLDYLAVTSAIANYPTKYEAENAAVSNAVIYSGANGALASNGSYVGGIDSTNSSVTFTVNVPATGLYDVIVRYAANAGAATQNIAVNGVSQGTISYPTTNGWSTSDLKTALKLIALKAGTNTIVFSKETNYAELDFINIAANQHRYEAETAAYNNVTPGVIKYAYVSNFYDDIGGINSADSSVTFSVNAPAAGTYGLQIGFANGSGTMSTHNLTVNGVASGQVQYSPTANYFGQVGGAFAGQQLATLSVSLAAGTNTIMLSKGTSFAELNFIKLIYTGAPAANGTETLTPVVVTAPDPQPVVTPIADPVAPVANPVVPQPVEPVVIVVTPTPIATPKPTPKTPKPVVVKPKKPVSRRPIAPYLGRPLPTKSAKPFSTKVLEF